ncbi:MAG: B12-binding domain-containing radical SAM protein [Candidatus Bathyarchaeota archaeon]|nr:MAG: B12-binding domain-containing radical SAM protein [Candidatus Bathyarchaeota archaeon]
MQVTPHTLIMCLRTSASFILYEGRKTSSSGTKIVLTSSATEMSDYYNSPFIAFVAGFAKGPVPLWILRRFLYPPVESNGDGRAKYSPYGLRKVEALLLENGFADSDIAVTHPSNLKDFIGPNTKAVGISSMDPTGMGYVSKTYSSLVGGGAPMNTIEFESLVNHRSVQKYKPKVIVGGYGSWQLQQKKVAENYGVNCVLLGGSTKTIIDVFRKAVNGESLPKVVRSGNGLRDRGMPLIRHAAIHGGVEISKGCGRNCQFCTPTMQDRRDISLDRIMKEVQITIREGASRVTLITEDLFLYGAKNKHFIPNKGAVLKLVKSIADYPGVKAIQPSHMSLAPVAYDSSLVQEVAEVLIDRSWYCHGKKPIVTSETGIETGSVRLMQKYMAGKGLPFKPEQWKEIVTQAFGILNDNSWYPLATLIVGLPDEKEEDIVETLELMDDLKDFNAFYVPLFFVPLDNCLLMNKRGAEVDSLSRIRWEFLIRCWQYNVRIWRDTFLEARITNPVLRKLVKRMLIPFAAKVAGIYYRMKYGEAMQDAIWKLAIA